MQQQRNAFAFADTHRVKRRRHAIRALVGFGVGNFYVTANDERARANALRLRAQDVRGDLLLER